MQDVVLKFNILFWLIWSKSAENLFEILKNELRGNNIYKNLSMTIINYIVEY